MKDWKSRIREAWSSALPPGPQVLQFEPRPEWIDFLDVQRWLSGKRWDEIAADDHEMEVEMPLPYLSTTACCYFLGGYLLYLAEAFEDECTGDLAPIHFASFLGSERFKEVMPGLSAAQREVLGEFAAAMLANESLFGLREDFAAKLASGANFLAGGQ
jgi:hypothetical protein